MRMIGDTVIRSRSHAHGALALAHQSQNAVTLAESKRSRFVEIHFSTGVTVDKLVHGAVKGYLGRFGTPNLDKT